MVSLRLQLQLAASLPALGGEDCDQGDQGEGTWLSNKGLGITVKGSERPLSMSAGACIHDIMKSS